MIEGCYMYSVSHWGQFPAFYDGWLPLCAAG
jgi:hypothetical protein